LNLLQIAKNAAQQDGNKTFLVYGETKRTYGQFYDRVLKLGAGLSKLGIKQGDRVAMMLNNSIEFIEAYFAVISTGAAIVPLNIFLKSDEVTFILNNCECKALFSSADFKKVIENLKPGNIPSLENIILVDDVPGIKYVKYESLIGQERIGEVKMSIEDMAAIIYTSGTTGKPKGAVMSHKNISSDVENCEYPLGIKKNDVFLIFLPMFHSYSFTANVMLPFHMHCKLVILKSVQPFTNVILSIIRHRVTIFISIPQIFTLLADRKLPFWFYKLNNLKTAISGGSSLPVESLKKFMNKFRIPLLEGYGLSEASPICSLNHWSRPIKAGSIGQPLDNIEIKIVDEAGKEVKTGVNGEIIVRGDNVMKGYFDDPEATKEAIKDGWLYTGDIARMDEDGYIFIMDRKKDLIIVNGMNVYPREIEEVFFQHPAVADAAIVGEKDSIHGEVAVAVVKLKEGMKGDEHEMRKFLKQRIANYKVPHRVEFWPELPRNASGKVLKREIKKSLEEKNKGSKTGVNA
jgi:long-chain acyl-CoA synthetase